MDPKRPPLEQKTYPNGNADGLDSETRVNG